MRSDFSLLGSPFWRKTTVIAIAGLTVACSSAQKRERIIGQTLVDIEPTTVQARKVAPESLETSIDRVEAHYRKALSVASDEETRRNIY